MRVLKCKLDELINHRIDACLFFALVILFINAGHKPSIDIIVGIFLCAIGFMKGPVKVDLKVVIPFVFYVIFGFASSYRAKGSIADGYAATHIVFPIICLFSSYLKGKDMRSFRNMCVFFSACMALIGIAQFLYTSLAHSAIRTGGIIGNPNPFGMFLVISYFTFIQCSETTEEKPLLWSYIEPVLLIALALTMSMGSFLAMAAGIVIIFSDKFRKSNLKEALSFTVMLAARANMGLALGILLYISASRSGIPWLCLPLALYISSFVLLWKRFEGYLAEQKYRQVIISALSLISAIVVILVRPSCIATLKERFEMMKNGFNYLTSNPLFGVGSYNWKQLNFIDNDKTFGTSHIHNAFMHAGVELGVPAMIMLIIVSIRLLTKRKSVYGCVTNAIFILHSFIDVVFFNVSVTSFLLATESELQYGGRYLSSAAAKTIFASLAFISLYTLYWHIIT